MTVDITRLPICCRTIPLLHESSRQENLVKPQVSKNKETSQSEFSNTHGMGQARRGYDTMHCRSTYNTEAWLSYYEHSLATTINEWCIAQEKQCILR